MLGGGKFENGAITGAFAYIASTDWGTNKLRNAFGTDNNWDNPNNRQQEIADAIKKFDFNTRGYPVRYDPNLPAGIDATTSPSAGVLVGPSAFSGSIGDFYSTLGHEIEVHITQIVKGYWSGIGQQSIMDEAEAYNYEIKNSARFGTANEVGGYRSQYNDKLGDLDAINRARALSGNYKAHPGF